MAQVKIVATHEDFIAHVKYLEAKAKALAECKHERSSDLTKGLGEIRHIHCPTCGWHLYKGKEYTKEAWYKWINDPKGYK